MLASSSFHPGDPASDVARDMLKTGGDIAVGPLPVCADAGELRKFAAALGLGSDAIPLTFPIRWLVLPPIRKAIEEVIGPNPIHLSQSFDYFAPLTADCDYMLNICIRWDTRPPRRVSLRATLNDRRDIRVLQSETILIPISAITRAPAAPMSESRREQFRDIAFGPFDKAQVARYAQAAHDDSRLHHDSAFARSLGLDRPIIHGMLMMGLFQNALTEWQIMGDVARLFCLFARPVLVGEHLFVSARTAVPAKGPEGPRECIRLLVHNERNEVACIGGAEFPPSQSRPI